METGRFRKKKIYFKIIDKKYNEDNTEMCVIINNDKRNSNKNY